MKYGYCRNSLRGCIVGITDLKGFMMYVVDMASCGMTCILLHVHPLLGNALVNKVPRKQMLGKQSLLGHATIGRMFIARC
jgi:hypothetical protein